MNFTNRFLALNSFAFFLIARADTLLDVQDADQQQLARIITMASMIGVVVAPILFGIIYTKFLLLRLQRMEAAIVVKEEPSTDTLTARINANKSQGALQLRLMDMKTNAVLRLWWKRQFKIHGIALDNDIESQLPSKAPVAAPVAVAPQNKKKKKDKDDKGHKKKSSSKSENAEPDEKKHKKKKKSASKLEVHESSDADVKKHKKHHKLAKSDGEKKKNEDTVNTKEDKKVNFSV